MNNTYGKTEILWTENYPMFKKLTGNRDVDRRNVERLKESILKHGVLPEPILVNEKFEVIDGQHRLQALRELGLPVPYVIQPGAGSNTAIALNIGQKNWTTVDYVRKYAAEGNPDYVFLAKLIERYRYALTETDILTFSCRDKAPGSKGYGGLPAMTRAGAIHIDISERCLIEAKIEWLARMAVLFKGIKGFKRNWVHALMFCFNNPEIDTERLTKKLEEHSYKLKPAADTKDAIDQIETIYNFRCSDNRVYISHLYQKSKDGGAK